MSFINLVGLGTNDPVPGNYVEVDFAQGPVGGFQGQYAAILLGGMLSSADVVAADVAGLFDAAASVAAPVTVLVAAMKAAGVAALLNYPRQVTITTGGTTPADAPPNCVVTGTDIDGNSISETLTLSQVAGTATSLKTYRTLVSVVYASADNTGATMSIGFALSALVIAGTATAGTVIYGSDTPTPCASESDVISLFGDGSELHRMWQRWTAINTTTPLYLLAIAEGSNPVASNGTITIAGSAAASGALRVWIGDRFVDTGFATSDSLTTIATVVVANINALPHCPVFATSAAGVVTIVTKQKGARSLFCRYMAQVIPSSSGITVTPTSATACTGGSVADSNATALTTIAAQNFYYIVSAAEDATQLTALMAQLNSQAQPTTGIRQSAYAGSIDTLANGVVISTAENAARLEIGWLYQSDMPPCEIAAHNAAVFALEEAGAAPRLNFNGYGQGPNDLWNIRAPLSGAAPTRAQIASALNAGLSPIAVQRGGATYLVKRATTRFLSGQTLDYRIRPPHKRLICDRYANDLVTKQQLQFAGKTIANDPVANEPVPGPTTVTPRVMKACINRLTDDYGENGMLQNVADIKAQTVCLRETSPSTRLSSKIPLQTIDLLDQTATLIAQVA